MRAAELPWLREHWRRLAAARAAGRVPHALLISGPPGIGKRLLAADFGRSLLCQTAAHAPCGDCAACAQWFAGSHPDAWIVAPEAAGARLKIEPLRALCAALVLTSQGGGHRVALIEAADSMTVAAANALLKTLEEPPPGVVIALLSDWPGRLPATVRSRCQPLRCAPPSRAAGLDWLREQGVEAPERALAASGGQWLAAAARDDAALALSGALDEALAALAAGRQGPAQAAQALAAAGAPAVLVALLARLESALREAAGAVASGAEIACLGARRTPWAAFALREQLHAELRLDPSGLNTAAALERVFSAVQRA